MSALRRDALAALARRYPEDYRRIYQSIKDGSPVDEVTVAEWAPQWLRLRERAVRPGTYDADRSAVTKWIMPSIGQRPLSALQPTDVRAVHEAAESAGLADATVTRVHAVLRKMLGDAIDEGHEVPERTLRTKKLGGVGTSQRQALSAEDARRILDVAMTRPDASRWVAALLQGMRPAEALGLRWTALDLDRGLMTVEWQLKPLPYRITRDRHSGFRVPRGFESIHLTGPYHLVRPKTNAGVRMVEMAEPVPEVDDDQIPIAQRRTLDQLTNVTCRWPVGTPGQPDFFFCGGKARDGLPYCGYHYCVAYQPPAARRVRTASASAASSRSAWRPAR